MAKHWSAFVSRHRATEISLPSLPKSYKIKIFTHGDINPHDEYYRLMEEYFNFETEVEVHVSMHGQVAGVTSPYAFSGGIFVHNVYGQIDASRIAHFVLASGGIAITNNAPTFLCDIDTYIIARHADPDCFRKVKEVVLRLLKEKKVVYARNLFPNQR